MLWHTLGSWTISVRYYPDPTCHWGVMARTRIFSMCALWPWPWRYDLRSRSWHTLGSWTISVWNIIKIQIGKEEFSPDTDSWYVCTVTLTLEIWPWVKVMAHPWAMDNCEKYYPDWTSGYEVMALTLCEQTDRVILIYPPPQTLFAGGGGGGIINRWQYSVFWFAFNTTPFSIATVKKHYTKELWAIYFIHSNLYMYIV